MADAPQIPDEAEVRARWGAFAWTAENAEQAKNLAHPEAGALEIQFSAFTVNGAPHQQLVIYQAAPASRTAAAFAELGSRPGRGNPHGDAEAVRTDTRRRLPARG